MEAEAAGRRVGAGRSAKLIAIGLVSAGLLVSVAPARADEPHDPQRSGHPLRILGYALHPVGLLLDTLIFRPAHWLVNHEPFDTIFGHED